MIKKALCFSLAVPSALVGIYALTTTKPVYGAFYILVALLLVLFPFSVTKERKMLLLAFLFIGLFLAIGVQIIIEGNLVWGLVCVAVTAIIVYKERVEIVKQYHELTK